MLRRYAWMLTLSAVPAISACSDPVPPSAAAGLNLNIGRCAPLSNTLTVGNPHPDRFRSDGPAGNPVYSGEGGTRVQCRISGDGTYSVFGDIRGQRFGFRVEGSIAANGMGMASVELSTTGIGTVSSSGCSLNVITTDRGPQITSGAVWAQVFCSDLTAQPSTSCSAQGEFLFERCGT